MIAQEQDDAVGSGVARSVGRSTPIATAWLRRLTPSPGALVLGLAVLAVLAVLGLAADVGRAASAALLALTAAALVALALASLQRESVLRRRLEAHLELSSDWCWETDAELRFTYLSPSFAATTGIPAAH